MNPSIAERGRVRPVAGRTDGDFRRRGVRAPVFRSLAGGPSIAGTFLNWLATPMAGGFHSSHLWLLEGTTFISKWRHGHAAPVRSSILRVTHQSWQFHLLSAAECQALPEKRWRNSRREPSGRRMNFSSLPLNYDKWHRVRGVGGVGPPVRDQQHFRVAVSAVMTPLHLAFYAASTGQTWPDRFHGLRVGSILAEGPPCPR